MKEAELHPKETERIQVIKSKNILDSKPDPRFDKITKEAVEKLKVPISAVTIIDDKREWHKSCVGLDQKEGPRKISFCGHALLEMDIMIVEDTLEDERFFDNPYVVGPPFLRFYAGMRLLDRKTSLPIGVFCVKDTEPRKFEIEDLGIFMELAARAETLLNEEI